MVQKTEAAPSADTNKAKAQTANATVTAPKTGDTFQPVLWAPVLGISVVGLFGMAVVSRKKTVLKKDTMKHNEYKEVKNESEKQM